jgi:hypothetical protein
MRRELRRRLEKLEARRPRLEIGGLFWPTEIVNRQAIRPNERIVEDWYLDSQNEIQSTSERITTAQEDQGWNYRDTADGRTIVSNLQREITVVNGAHFYRALSISKEDSSIDSKNKE